jgi:hypothetical protein
MRPGTPMATLSRCTDVHPKMSWHHSDGGGNHVHAQNLCQVYGRERRWRATEAALSDVRLSQADAQDADLRSTEKV